MPLDTSERLAAALLQAETSNSDQDWQAVDQLAIELSKKCNASVNELRVLVGHAIRRLGGHPGELPDPGPASETWMEHIFTSIIKSMADVEAVHQGRIDPLRLHSIGDGSKMVSISEAWAETLGYNPKDIIGRPTTEFMTDESKRAATEIWLPQFWETGTVSGARYDYLTKDGKRVPIELSASAERDKSGRITRSLAIISLR